MKKYFMLLALVSVVGVSACNTTKEDLGLERKTPDASKAVSKNPLILPPNYNLRPVVPMEKADLQASNAR